MSQILCLLTSVINRSSNFLRVSWTSSDCFDSLTELILRARLCIAPSAWTRCEWSGWSRGVFSNNLYKIKIQNNYKHNHDKHNQKADN